MFFELLSLAMFTYFGIFTVSVTPNVTVRCPPYCNSAALSPRQRKPFAA
jgi:hypothetical protein